MQTIVWTAVAAAVLGVIAIAVSLAGGPLGVILALGFSGITLALLNLKN